MRRAAETARSGLPRPPEPRLRQAFVNGAEVSSPRFGRGLTAEELERALRTYSGDVADHHREQMMESIRFFARQIEAAVEVPDA